MSYRKMKIVAATTLATLVCFTTPYVVTGVKPVEIINNINAQTYKGFVRATLTTETFAEGIYDSKHLYSLVHKKCLGDEEIYYEEYKTQVDCKKVDDVFELSDYTSNRIVFTKKDGKWVSKDSPLEDIAKQRIKEKLGVEIR